MFSIDCETARTGTENWKERVRSLCLWEPHTPSQPVVGTYQDGWAHGYREAMNRVLALLDTPEAEPEAEPVEAEPVDAASAASAHLCDVEDRVLVAATSQAQERLMLAAVREAFHLGEMAAQPPPDTGVTREEPTLRDQFEQWVACSPRPWALSTERFDPPWPDEYRDDRVQFAWEAWQESARLHREED